MQKKIIALAIAGLASTAAFAQTNVTIYGIMDYGVSYRFDATDGRDAATAINGGQQSGNRLGFKGTEDLGNGLKAVFLFEQGFQGDSTNGNSTDSANQNLTFNRQSYVGLTGGFGTLVGGRLYTPHYNFLTSLDPFAGGSVGKYNNTYGSASGMGGLADPVRVDNAVAYISPNFGGFTVTGAYSNNALANDSLNYAGDNNRVYAILGEYKAGMFQAGVSYHFIDVNASQVVGNALNNVESVQTVVVGGSVDLGVAKIAGFMSYGMLDGVVGDATDADLYNYMLGVTVPIGKVSLKASGNYSDLDNAGVGDSSYQIAVGADYALSKRTNLYTAYSFIDNSDGRLSAVGDSTNSGKIPGFGTYQQGFQFGVRHMF